MLEIIIPVKNGGNALKDTLLSLSNIDFNKKCLLTISDNYSSDNCPWKKVISELKNLEVKLLVPPKEMDRVEHWNWAFSKTTGLWIKPVMVGDLIKVNYFKEVFNAIEEHPNSSLIFCTNQEQRKDKVVYNYIHLENQIVNFEEYLDLSLKNFNFIGALSGVVFNKEKLEKALPFEEKYPWTADWRIYTKLALQGPLFYIKYPGIILNRKITRYSSKTIPVVKGILEEIVYWNEIWELRYQKNSLNKYLRILSYLFLQFFVRIGRIYMPSKMRVFLVNNYKKIRKP